MYKNKKRIENTFKCILTLLTITSLFFITGCGSKDSALTSFETNLTNFTENISTINEAISNIDPTSDNAEENLLTYLSALDDQIALLADLEVPEEFSSIESLADDATIYMNEALTLFTDTYTEEILDEAKLEAAIENYTRAMSRLGYISDLLQGLTPEGDDVIVEESDAEFDAVEHEDDSSVEE
ncbi:MAG: hypothetical protein R3Y24_00650 [Eubacteriales bacterium]